MRLPIKQLAQTVLEMLVVRKNKKIKATLKDIKHTRLLTVTHGLWLPFASKDFIRTVYEV